MMQYHKGNAVMLLLSPWESVGHTEVAIYIDILGFLHLFVGFFVLGFVHLSVCLKKLVYTSTIVYYIQNSVHVLQHTFNKIASTFYNRRPTK